MKHLEIHLAPEAKGIPVTGVASDSREVRPGDLFVAVPGPLSDGASFIPEALQKGASVIVTEQKISVGEGVLRVIVSDARKALAFIASRFYETPSQKLHLVGITGTNGKTTASYLVTSLLREAGYRVGLIGTIAHQLGGRLLPAQNTTPGILDLHRMLSEMVEGKTDYAVMEVSSHALDQGRVETLRFQTALFTNLTQDHLDYHKTKEAYFKAKARLFEELDEKATAVLNADSPYTEAIQELARGLGYRGACTTNRGVSKSALDLFGLRRIKMTEADRHPWLLRVKLSGFYDTFRALRAPG